jgi:Tol biopolymer transport system component
VDREGNEEPVAAEPQAYAEFTLSPDGTQLAVRVAADNPGVWIYDLVRDTPTRLTLGPAAEIFPVWTPDGQRVAFGGVEGMSWKAADGTGGVEPLLENPSNQYPNAFSPDGRWIAYQSNESGQF